MSTFLQLVRDLHRESGAAGSAPTSVLGQTDEALRLVNWIKEANDFVIDLWDDWKFLRKTYQSATVQSEPTLPAPSDVQLWDLLTFKVVEPSGNLTLDKMPLEAVEYDDIKDEILDETEGTPFRVIIMPDDTLMFEGVPDGAYTVFADFFRTPTPLVNNTDESDIPAKYRQVILGRALILYANYEHAEEIKAQGNEIYATFLGRLENKQLPGNQNNSRYRTGRDGGFEVIGSQ